MLLYKGQSVSSNQPIIEMTEAEYEANKEAYDEMEIYVCLTDAEEVTPADYVVEQGTSNGWTYRKWNSGIAECWLSKWYTYNKDFTGVTDFLGFATVMGNDSAFPIIFTATPIITTSILGSDANGYGIPLVSNSSTTTNAVGGYMFPTYAVNMRSIIINHYVIGKWK